MTMGQLYLGLDFDGVIADSIGECLVVARNAYWKFLGIDKSIISLNQMTDEEIRQRRYLRNFIRSGQDYVFIEHIINLNHEVNDQQDFDAFCTAHQNLDEKFFALFYGERERLSNEHFREWVNLNPLYPGIRKLLIKYRPKENLFIITTKKTEFADKILKANGIELISKNLFHASKSKGKGAIIEELITAKSIVPSNFVFVDDQIDTLIKLKNLGIKLYFATWGYNNERQLQLAKEKEIECLDLPGFLEKIAG